MCTSTAVIAAVLAALSASNSSSTDHLRTTWDAPKQDATPRGQTGGDGGPPMSHSRSRMVI
jgi:hypothetical protein